MGDNEIENDSFIKNSYREDVAKTKRKFKN